MILLLTVTEAALIAVGVLIAYRVARMATHAPLGWWLLLTSFVLAFGRAMLFLASDLSAADTSSLFLSMGEAITLPIVVLILWGVYKFYVDFKSQLGSMQAMSDPPEQASR